MSEPPLRRLDVSRLRVAHEVVVIERSLDRPLLVLGSSQPDSMILDRGTIESVRRRGGGGAVLLTPFTTIWIDLWLPTRVHGDRGVRSLLAEAGALFVDALTDVGVEGLHTWDAGPGAARAAVCFAGLGHGEVVDAERRKLVGLTAWRCREGALVQAALYVRRDQSLPGLLAIDDAERASIAEALAERVADLESLGISMESGSTFGHRLSMALSSRASGRLERWPPELAKTAALS